MLVSYADILTASDLADGTFLVTPNGGITPYYPAPVFGAPGQQGYAVALHPLAFTDEGLGSFADVTPGELLGTWLDTETGIFHVDRVVHVKGSESQALLVASAFNQKAIFSFGTGRVIEVPVTVGQ